MAVTFSVIMLTVICAVFLPHSPVHFNTVTAASSESDLPASSEQKSTRCGAMSKYEESMSTTEASSSNASKAEMETKSCNLLSESYGGPTPVILMSLGRSGSASTWQVMGQMTGKVTESVEYTGSSTKKSKEFFKNIADGLGDWLTEYLCYQQTEYPDAGIVGFKWKPNQSIFMESAKAGLVSIAESKDPMVKVVRSRRNLLDVLISATKHRTSFQVHAHCQVDDTKCVESHFKAGSNLTLNSKSLVKQLRQKKKQEDDVDDLLDEMGVPHVHVSFEKLYHSNDADEWMRIFRFLGRGPSENLTHAEVSQAMLFAATSHMDHNATLGNFEEIRQTLKGTEFEELLH